MRKSKIVIPFILLGVAVIVGVFYLSGNQYNYTLAAEWGGFGYADEDGKFQLPYGSAIYTDENGKESLLITDCHNDNIQKFALDGTFISKFGESGTEPGSLDVPADVAIDKNGNIWVVEEDTDRLSQFDKNGNFLENFTATLEIEEEEGQVRSFSMLSKPLGIVFDSANNFYISNFGNGLVMKFDADGNFDRLLNKRDVDEDPLQFIARIEEERGDREAYYLCRSGTAVLCTGEAEFNSPYYLVVDSKDNVYVVDRNNHRIQKFNSDGEFLLMWGRNGGDGTSGNGEGEFNYPHEIAIDKNDNVYIADSRNHRIQVFDSEGAFLFQLGDESVFGFPKVVAVDSDLNIYVGDTEFPEGDHIHDEESDSDEEISLHEHTEDEHKEGSVGITKWKKTIF